jgi:hypothetical protein
MLSMMLMMEVIGTYRDERESGRALQGGRGALLLVPFYTALMDRDRICDSE